MPGFVAKDSLRHNGKLKNSPLKQRQWADVANNGMKRGLSEGEAIREANGIVGRSTTRRKMK